MHASYYSVNKKAAPFLEQLSVVNLTFNYAYSFVSPH